MIVTAFLIFLGGFCADVLWTLYIHAAAKEKRLLSSFYSAVIGVTSYAFLSAYKEGIFYYIIWICGLFFGTYFAKPIESFIFSKIFKK